MVSEDLPHLIDGISTKGRTILKFASENTSFAGDEFDHLTDCHTGRETMGVHHEIGAPAIALTEGHVFSRDDKANDTFLTVTRTEFVTDLRHTSLPSDHFKDALFLKVRCNDHSVDVDWVGSLENLFIWACLKS